MHAREIAEAVGAASWEVEAVTHAALWHDIGRTHDGADYYHGAKSAGKAVGLGLQIGLEERVREAALFAVTHHSGSEWHAEQAAAYSRDREATLRVFRILKDADALDRVRLGDLDPSYLRFDVSHGRLDRAWALLEAVS
jgi:HD superfamily phosphodiesterase